MNRLARVLAALALTSLAAACAPDATATIQREDSCGRTQCMANYQACVANDNCNQCLSTCTQSDDPSCWDTCNAICGHPADGCTPCPSPDDSACLEPSVHFTLPAPDDDVRRACEALNAQRTACGAPASDLLRCAVDARIAQHDVAAVFQCVAALACGADDSGCYPSTPDGTLGDDLAARLGACADHGLDDPTRVLLDAWEPAWRADVVAALRGCIAEDSCATFVACTNGWFDAITNDPTDDTQH